MMCGRPMEGGHGGLHTPCHKRSRAKATSLTCVPGHLTQTTFTNCADDESSQTGQAANRLAIGTRPRLLPRSLLRLLLGGLSDALAVNSLQSVAVQSLVW